MEVEAPLGDPAGYVVGEPPGAEEETEPTGEPPSGGAAI
jgi:hypothetical protein